MSSTSPALSTPSTSRPATATTSAPGQFLEWFVAEQGEEEKSTADLIAKFDLLGGDAKGLYLLNAELKNRA